MNIFFRTFFSETLISCDNSKRRFTNKYYRKIHPGTVILYYFTITSQCPLRRAEQKEQRVRDQKNYNLESIFEAL